MENQENKPQRPVNPRRRRKSKFQIFKEAYLPFILIVLALVLVIVFIVTAVNRAKTRRAEEAAASSAAAASSEAEQQRLDDLAAKTLAEAKSLAASYYYDEAIDKLNSFEGSIYDYDALLQARQSYEDLKDNLVLWNDPSKVPNLSFHLLMVDAKKAFANKQYGESFEWNFITTDEFRGILEQLYENGYVLVMMDDIVKVTASSDGTYTYSAKDLYLPEGKKPLMITQTQVNYFTYMIDGSGDGMPDADGSGFASKLVVKNGVLTNEMVDDTNQTVNGEYDLVPILNSFIKAHPDFSYQGAKAVLAVCAYDGLFGYRTDPETLTKHGAAFYENEVADAKALIQALRDDGYSIACYTYSNTVYGSMSASRIEADLKKWADEVTPILGECDILVYSKNSDISDKNTPYSGDKYDVLKKAGFKYFYGFCENYGSPWIELGSYVRQGRIMVTGNNLLDNPGMFEDFFEASEIRDKLRR
ncbi:MAG: hypothetical protein IJO56_00170 [Oscillospiraceae bacterium]|nr:hypothetical protein [Oscillospiraceae bacterium]